MKASIFSELACVSIFYNQLSINAGKIKAIAATVNISGLELLVQIKV